MERYRNSTWEVTSPDGSKRRFVREGVEPFVNIDLSNEGYQMSEFLGMIEGFRKRGLKIFHGNRYSEEYQNAKRECVNRIVHLENVIRSSQEEITREGLKLEELAGLYGIKES